MLVPLQVLIVEDSPDDAELMVLHLKKEGFQLDWRRVQEEQEFLDALDPPPDVILADWSLPQFSGLYALQRMRERGLDIPFVIVSGSIGEEIAVDVMRQGVSDYVLKDRPARLGQAVRHAIEDKRIRDDRRCAEEALRASEARYREFIDAATDPIFIKDAAFRYVAVNKANLAFFGKTEADILGKTDFELLPEDQARQCQQSDRRALETNGLVLSIEQADGRIYETRKFPISLGAMTGIGGFIRDITEQRNAEAAMALQSAALQVAANGIIITGANGAIEWVNTAFTLLTGYSFDECVGRRLGDLVHSGIQDKAFYADLWNTILSGRVWRGELTNRRKDGSLYYEEQTITPVTDANGTIVHFVAIKQDITARKHAEAALLASETRYRLIVETAQEGIWIFDAEARTTFVNQRMAEIVGRTVEEMMGRPFFDFVGEASAELVAAMIERHRQGITERHELTFQRKDGTAVHTLVSAHPLHDAQGHYTGTHALITDISELKHTQAAEHDQRVLAEALRDTAAALISAVNTDAVMTAILENVARVVPHDAANIMLIENDGARVAYWRGYRSVPNQTLEARRFLLVEAPHLQHMLATGLPYLVANTDHYQGWLSQPHTEWIKSYVAAPIRSHGNVIGFLNVDSGTPGFFTSDHAARLQAFADQASVAIEHAQLYEEISGYASQLEQRVAQRTTEFQNSEARYRAIIEDQTDLIVRYLPGGILTFVNQAYCAFFQRPPHDLLGTSFFDRLPVEERERAQQHIASLSRENPVATIERREIAADGTLRWVQWIDRMVFDRDGNFVEYQAVGRDITARKHAEELIQQTLSHEMELNELQSRYVSMAAHDLRNPLAIIKSSVDILDAYGTRMTEEQTRSRFDTIQTTIQIMVDLLDDILTLGRAESGQRLFTPTRLDVADFCKNLTTELGQTMNALPRVQFSTQEDCHDAYVDPKLLRHILSNLLSNALKYSPDDSPVEFTVRCAPQHISFRIQDSGIGIPAESQKRLFEAFYRAHNARHLPGTGLGLAIVKRSVDLHGGAVTFESQEGQGTTVTVTIPQNVPEAGG